MSFFEWPLSQFNVYFLASRNNCSIYIFNDVDIIVKKIPLTYRELGNRNAFWGVVVYTKSNKDVHQQVIT